MEGDAIMEKVKPEEIVAGWMAYALVHQGGMMFAPYNGISHCCGRDVTAGWTIEDTKKSPPPSGCPYCHRSWCD